MARVMYRVTWKKSGSHNQYSEWTQDMRFDSQEAADEFAEENVSRVSRMEKLEAPAAPQRTPGPEVVAAIKAHARKNYSRGGWYRIRALTDKQLAEVLAGTTTQMSAYRRAKRYISDQAAAA